MILQGSFSAKEKKIVDNAFDFFDASMFETVVLTRNPCDAYNNGSCYNDYDGIIHMPTYDNFEFILYHEMRHRVQFCTGRLKRRGHHSMQWEDSRPVIISKVTVEMYHQLPWEIDANGYAISCASNAKDLYKNEDYHLHLKYAKVLF